MLGIGAGLIPAAAHAQAAAQTVDGLAAAPIVRVVLGSGTVNVRTWDRDAVQIDDASAVTVRRFTVQAGAVQSTMPILAGRVGSPDGPVELPEESFAVSTLAPGMHDVVAVRGKDANVTVDVPKSAALLTVQMGKGTATISDYQNGTFVARVHNGTVRLQNVGGDGYVQVMRGPILADGSTFSRVRMRSGTGDIVLSNCRAKQIEVSSVRGSIVDDGGSFEPGLARFETQYGNVALGVSGRAELAAHASGGHVFSALEGAGQLSGRDGEQVAAFGHGGPLVNATSVNGNVYFYSGQLSSHRTAPEWQPVRAALQRVGRPAGAQAPARPAAGARSTINPDAFRRIHFAPAAMPLPRVQARPEARQPERVARPIPQRNAERYAVPRRAAPPPQAAPRQERRAERRPHAIHG
jgi:hypothetical protein